MTPPAGTGMDELIIFQINTYMTGNPFFFCRYGRIPNLLRASFSYLLYGNLGYVGHPNYVSIFFCGIPFLYKCEVSPEQSTPRLLLPPPR